MKTFCHTALTISLWVSSSAAFACSNTLQTDEKRPSRRPTSATAAPMQQSSNIFINELHYDNTGSDTGEGVEIAGPAGTDLGDYRVEFYNGTNGTVYATLSLSGVIEDQQGGFGVLSFTQNAIQNGSPDGLALVAPNGTVKQFLSYEGLVSATDGAAAGTTSVNIGVAEEGSTAAGESLQLAGVGMAVSDFTWQGAAPSTFGEPSFGQTFADAPEIEPGGCGDAASLIHSVQSAGSVSPLIGQVLSIEGVVVANYQGTSLGGFFVQEESRDFDADPATSEGVFVFDPAALLEVADGDLVRVTAEVAEVSGQTQLQNLREISLCATGQSTVRTELRLPVSSVSDFEAYEGMRVLVTQPLVVTDLFNQGRFGEVELALEQRLLTPTQVMKPGAAANELQTANDRRRILLDDASTIQNPAPLPYAGVRAGDSVSGLDAILSFAFGSYRLQPRGSIVFDRTNARDVNPEDVGGRLQVVSFNVQNYFTTLAQGQPACGPAARLDCRGANNAGEFTRQRDKIFAALSSLDADIIGLVEVENHPEDAALADLVRGLNTTLGNSTYAAVRTGPIGTDAIKVSLIYKPARVRTVGDFAILDTRVDPRFVDDKNRPALIQTFAEVTSGERFTVAVNHFKSKGSNCNDLEDPDVGDGQGNCSATRTNAALALVDFLAQDPTASGDPDFLIMGDLNAYAKEDPMTAIVSRGYENLNATRLAPRAYSYGFRGQYGTLDYLLASASLSAQVTGSAEWHINADEPPALDYNTEFNLPESYQADAFRASDHDPIIVGLSLGQ